MMPADLEDDNDLDMEGNYVYIRTVAKYEGWIMKEVGGKHTYEVTLTHPQFDRTILINYRYTSFKYISQQIQELSDDGTND